MATWYPAVRRGGVHLRGARSLPLPVPYRL